MTRREFATLTTGAAFAACSEPAPADEQPNILFAISDDQSFSHTSLAGDKVVKTPVFEAVAANGIYFPNADCCTPSCTPSRTVILSGQHAWRLREAGSLCNQLPTDLRFYTDMLSEAGYELGRIRKGWAPGLFNESGRPDF